MGTSIILEALGAHELCVLAGRLIDAGFPSTYASNTSSHVIDLATAATRVVAIAWAPGGRPPAAHVIEAIVALAGEPQVILVAVAAVLARLRACQHSPDAPQRALEALSLWAPIAARFQFRSLQRELEDLAFKMVDRPAYDAVARFVSLRRGERDQAVDTAKSDLIALLQEFGIEAEVKGRAKNLWSIHQKRSQREDHQPTIYDLFGLRVLVADEAKCYEVLGLVHAAYVSLPKRFKDYVASPKPNGYRSIHTVVQMPKLGDALIEIQIRSHTMHEHAEQGVAAHFQYKYPSMRERTRANYVYVLTPRNEVRRLPRGATPLDFAYAIHTELGWGSAGARVNGKIVPLTTPLLTGDVVEILHSTRARPTAGQLGRVQTARARNRIRQGLLLLRSR